MRRTERGGGRPDEAAQVVTFDDLVARAVALAAGPRRILGITGPPGAGKSSLAARLVVALADRAVLVPMDGFHLAERELHRLGRHARKGAIDTFDADGFVALIRRMQRPGGATVYAPEFRRELEEAVAGAIAVTADVPLVVTEGNYLLVPDGPWAELRELLDEVWYLDLDERVRLKRLADRHVAFGRGPAEAAARARGTDQANAELIATTADRADAVIRLASAR
ncbi:MAG TPA: nucleoside/nucleotide kinase family protein [Micromonosporaceae bacterium]|nr:nucleoside/nucleotide kinase family protein [Micromonosporaceae bacterium]